MWYAKYLMGMHCVLTWYVHNIYQVQTWYVSRKYPKSVTYTRCTKYFQARTVCTEYLRGTKWVQTWHTLTVYLSGIFQVLALYFIGTYYVLTCTYLVSVGTGMYHEVTCYLVHGTYPILTWDIHALVSIQFFQATYGVLTCYCLGTSQIHAEFSCCTYLVLTRYQLHNVHTYVPSTYWAVFSGTLLSRCKISLHSLIKKV